MQVIGEKNWPVQTTVVTPDGERNIYTFPDVECMLFVVNQWQQIFGADIEVHIRTLGAQDN